jgi:hypothetical protein
MIALGVGVPVALCGTRGSMAALVIRLRVVCGVFCRKRRLLRVDGERQRAVEAIRGNLADVSFMPHQGWEFESRGRLHSSRNMRL